MASNAEQEIAARKRFSFGANWWRFLQQVDAGRIAGAETALVEMLGSTQQLKGSKFLDAGSGSGLMSLAAANLGAEVTSFDFDPRSVSCTRELKRRYRPYDDSWTILEGSVLDNGFLRELGTFEIVYSWGVLHHTGAMWQAVANTAALVRTGGLLFIALYNDQGRSSARWTKVKRAYNAVPSARPVIIALSAARLLGPTFLREILSGHPLRATRGASHRGMSQWVDVVDWVGGWPFEVARPEEVLDFLRPRGFVLERLRTVGGGLGCNEFVFRSSWSGP